ncbi:MAG: hypothetical protein JO291_16685 [Acidimicrobiia bacterium]|nr:hypothetical protein [Acidimicrobiia bacterium]
MSDPAPPASVAPRDDWPAQAADTIVRVVGQVRDKTTGPAITASRAIVFGLLAAILGTVLLVAVSMVLLRVTVIGVHELLDVTNLERPGREVWIAYFVDAALFALIGAVLWRRASRNVS